MVFFGGWLSRFKLIRLLGGSLKGIFQPGLKSIGFIFPDQKIGLLLLQPTHGPACLQQVCGRSMAGCGEPCMARLMSGQSHIRKRCSMLTWDFEKNPMLTWDFPMSTWDFFPNMMLAKKSHVDMRF